MASLSYLWPHPKPLSPEGVASPLSPSYNRSYSLLMQEMPFKPSMFGTTVEELFEFEKQKFPERHSFKPGHVWIPWVVEVLVETVLKLNGPQTEGIFR